MSVIRKLTFPFRKCRELKGYGGCWGFLKGAVRTVRHYFLLRRYGCDPWHISVIEWRKYAIDLCRYARELVEKEKLQCVVEVGCGLGELISRIPVPRRIGLDLDENVIRAAARIHHDVDFRVGSFDDVQNLSIDLLIAVNFPHNIPPDELAGYYQRLSRQNRLRHVIVDSVDYKYFHDYEAVLGPGWERVWQSPVFGSKRTVLCYRNNEISHDGGTGGSGQ